MSRGTDADRRRSAASAGPPDGGEPPTSLWQTLGSVLAAFFGVQSSANRRRDFSRGKPLHFVVVGLLVTAAFVGAVMLAVRLALSQAG